MGTRIGATERAEEVAGKPWLASTGAGAASRFGAVEVRALAGVAVGAALLVIHEGLRAPRKANEVSLVEDMSGARCSTALARGRDFFLGGGMRARRLFV